MLPVRAIGKPSLYISILLYNIVVVVVVIRIVVVVVAVVVMTSRQYRR